MFSYRPICFSWYESLRWSISLFLTRCPLAGGTLEIPKSGWGYQHFFWTTFCPICSDSTSSWGSNVDTRSWCQNSQISKVHEITPSRSEYLDHHESTPLYDTRTIFIKVLPVCSYLSRSSANTTSIDLYDLR